MGRGYSPKSAVLREFSALNRLIRPSAETCVQLEMGDREQSYSRMGSLEILVETQTATVRAINGYQDPDDRKAARPLSLPALPVWSPIRKLRLPVGSS
jgi:hypothetical protein